jgi:hypothetical protein
VAYGRRLRVPLIPRPTLALSSLRAWVPTSGKRITSSNKNNMNCIPNLSFWYAFHLLQSERPPPLSVIKHAQLLLFEPPENSCFWFRAHRPDRLTSSTD